MKKHNHLKADELKGHNVFICPICRKIIEKGKTEKSKGGMFGKPKWKRHKKGR